LSDRRKRRITINITDKDTSQIDRPNISLAVKWKKNSAAFFAWLNKSCLLQQANSSFLEKLKNSVLKNMPPFVHFFKIAAKKLEDVR
jgi:hypothetical protein